MKNIPDFHKNLTTSNLKTKEDSPEKDIDNFIYTFFQSFINNITKNFNFKNFEFKNLQKLEVVSLLHYI